MDFMSIFLVMIGILLIVAWSVGGVIVVGMTEFYNSMKGGKRLPNYMIYLIRIIGGPGVWTAWIIEEIAEYRRSKRLQKYKGTE